MMAALSPDIDQDEIEGIIFYSSSKEFPAQQTKNIEAGTQENWTEKKKKRVGRKRLSIDNGTEDSDEFVCNDNEEDDEDDDEEVDEEGLIDIQPVRTYRRKEQKRRVKRRNTRDKISDTSSEVKRESSLPASAPASTVPSPVSSVPPEKPVVRPSLPSISDKSAVLRMQNWGFSQLQQQPAAPLVMRNIVSPSPVSPKRYSTCETHIKIAHFITRYNRSLAVKSRRPESAIYEKYNATSMMPSYSFPSTSMMPSNSYPATSLISSNAHSAPIMSSNVQPAPPLMPPSLPQLPPLSYKFTPPQTPQQPGYFNPPLFGAPMYYPEHSSISPPSFLPPPFQPNNFFYSPGYPYRPS